MAKAECELIEALSKLRMEGGDFYMNPDNLRKLTDLFLPTPEQDPKQDAAD